MQVRRLVHRFRVKRPAMSRTWLQRCAPIRRHPSSCSRLLPLPAAVRPTRSPTPSRCSRPAKAPLDAALHDSSNLIGAAATRRRSARSRWSRRARDDRGPARDRARQLRLLRRPRRHPIAGRRSTTRTCRPRWTPRPGRSRSRSTVSPGRCSTCARSTLTGAADRPPSARDALQLAARRPGRRRRRARRAGPHAARAARQRPRAGQGRARPVATLDPAAQALDVSYDGHAGPRGRSRPDHRQRARARSTRAYVRRRLLIHQGEPFDPDKIEKARAGPGRSSACSPPSASSAADAARRRPGSCRSRSTSSSGRATWSASTPPTRPTSAPRAGVTWTHRNLFGNAERLDLGAAITQLGGSASRGTGYNVTAALTKPDVLAPRPVPHLQPAGHQGEPATPTTARPSLAGVHAAAAS